MCKQVETLSFALGDLPSELARFLDRGSIAVLLNYATCTQQDMLMHEEMMFHSAAHVGNR